MFADDAAVSDRRSRGRRRGCRLTAGIVTNAPLTPSSAMPGGAAFDVRRVVVDDHRDRAGVGRVPGLHGEAAEPALDQRDLAGDGAGVVNGVQPSVDVPRGRFRRRPRPATTLADDVRIADRRAERRGAELVGAGDAGRGVDVAPSDCRTTARSARRPSRGPSSTTRPKLVADASRWALVICGQNLPSVVSNSLLL